jgi:two-component system, OmpR family, KDP operon response regulator KdpE
MAAPLILVADDDANLRDMLRMGLEARGYQVVTTADGWQAVQIATHEHPALIILDMHMVVRDGDWVVQQLRRQNVDIPVLLLTGDPHPEQWAQEIGAIGWVTKPFDFNVLYKQLEAVAPAA